MGLLERVQGQREITPLERGLAARESLGGEVGGIGIQHKKENSRGHQQ